MKRLKSFSRLSSSYLFPEIKRRTEAFRKDHPDADFINLGVGDTVLPLSPYVSKELQKAAADLGTQKGYSGYGQDQGLPSLRKSIAENIYRGNILSEEIFISDGAKCDIGRLQVLFSGARSVGLQDPAYPIYLEGSILQGIEKIHLLSCKPDNHFFPTLPPKLDLLYICNPNNPTGIAYTYAELKQLVDYAEEVGALILYDGAYSSYIQDSTIPQSIYDVTGARRVAIEVNSFSKMAGFTGIRLGWTVVPKELKFECGSSILETWKRLGSMMFNGASNIAQRGGLAVFQDQDWKANLSYYMENAALLKKSFKALGYTVYGGVHAPYLWVHTPGQLSWDVFQNFLEEKRLVVTPGVGYGPSGEHFIRISAFAHRSQIKNVINRIK